MVYEDSRNAKISKIFQLEVGALVSKIIHPEVTILSYVVKLWAQLGKAKGKKIFWVIFIPKGLRIFTGHSVKFYRFHWNSDLKLYAIRKNNSELSEETNIKEA